MGYYVFYFIFLSTMTLLLVDQCEKLVTLLAFLGYWRDTIQNSL